MNKSLITLLFCLCGSASAIDVSDVPADKRTTLDRYLTAVEAHRMVSESAANVLFLDVRTQAEVSYVGAPAGMDANIPFMLVDFDHFDSRSRRFTLHKNPAFVGAVEERLKAKGLDKTADVVLICRSGDRTTRAVNALAAAGFTRVWTVIDGFEGDTASAGADRGKRTVNGWKNSGLPWSYALDSSQVWLPAGAR
ncbi:rhodanese-like domain-containing protein [Methyloversatilis sp. XJ19-49]|uniref:rhodanese-like domain-containing protein n=1 Tax=Methyloversatilis sp. XJ19-49 TaxID=2963429 RepID=UPI00211CDCFB|nr:rhodanese-like domain-containing protein [Methyloversatilis sp. XJ19-49]MCQ9376692.1 rhodanese-like domain-containing protein [Methyloversatilis sp. XJ19-49]